MAAMTINDERLVAQLRLGALIHRMEADQYLSVLLADDLDVVLERTADAVFRSQQTIDAFEELLDVTQ